MMKQHTNILSAPLFHNGAGFARIIKKAYDGTTGLVACWAARARSRRELGELDNHLLDDVGISRTERDRECAKPPWKP